MTKVVNLNRARKTKARDSAQAAAAENRVKFGRTKVEKTLGKTLAAKAARQLDQSKRQP